MSKLQYRQKKIQERRKDISFKDFIREMASWIGFPMYKVNGIISRYPNIQRTGILLCIEELKELNGEFLNRKIDLSNNAFFETLFGLYKNIPKSYLLDYGMNENIHYCDSCYSSNTCYLSNTILHDSGHALYSYNVRGHCDYIYNSAIVMNNSSIIFMSQGIHNSQKIYYSRCIYDSNNIRFSTNMMGCEECIFCDGLHNKSFCINNEQFKKSEFYERKRELLENKNLFDRYHDALSSLTSNFACENIAGAGCVECYNGVDVYYCSHIKNGKNVVLAGGTPVGENFTDIYAAGAGSVASKDFCAVNHSGLGASHIYCSTSIIGGSQIYYSMFLESCSYCLGCIGLKNKSFCIFNKQYSKEERHEKVDEMFTKMEQDGTLGEFFPGRMNPFYFNDTAAYLIDDSFTKEEVTAKGYLRRDEQVKVDIPEGVEVVKVNELDQYEGWIDETGNIISHAEQSEESLRYKRDPSLYPGGRTGYTRYIDPKILEKVIQDEQGNVYRIVKMEYDFLMKHALPLPRLHWLERLKVNFRIS